MSCIALLGEYRPSYGPHESTNRAIQHSSTMLNVDVQAEWVSTEDIDHRLFEKYSGLWIAPGSPYKNLGNTLWAIQQAREHRIPCFGTCGGFQHMVIEYARNVLGFQDAHHAEYSPDASNLFISQLDCSLAGRIMHLTFSEDSHVAAIYGEASATEQYYCNFGVNPSVVSMLKSGPMRITGSDAEGDIRVVEYPGHPFFIGTLFIPQSKSTAERPHPLVTAFLKAVLENRVNV
ncbi:MAG: hypothetical protein U0236_09855 [Nitrospira sp.]